MNEGAVEFSASDLRDAVRQACDDDPGPLEPTERLGDVGLHGMDLLLCIATLEERFGIEFPADLVASLETVDDLLYFTTTKLSQRC